MAVSRCSPRLLFCCFRGCSPSTSAITGQFLPHDERFLGMTSEALCAVQGCRIVHFMVHDRVSFGGVLVAIGLLYLWLIESPLARRAGVGLVALAPLRRRWLLQLLGLSELRLPRLLARGRHPGTAALFRFRTVPSPTAPSRCRKVSVAWSAPRPVGPGSGGVVCSLPPPGC